MSLPFVQIYELQGDLSVLVGQDVSRGSLEIINLQSNLPAQVSISDSGDMSQSYIYAQPIQLSEISLVMFNGREGIFNVIVNPGSYHVIIRDNAGVTQFDSVMNVFGYPQFTGINSLAANDILSLVTQTDGSLRPSWTVPPPSTPAGPRIYSSCYFVNFNVDVNGNFFGTYGTNQRVFLNNQNSFAEIGIYVVTDMGGNVYTLERAPDMQLNDKVYHGSVCFDVVTLSLYQFVGAYNGQEDVLFQLVGNSGQGGVPFIALPGAPDPRLIITLTGYYSPGIVIGTDNSHMRVESIDASLMTNYWVYLCTQNIVYDSSDYDKVLKLYNNGGSTNSLWDYPISHGTPASSGDTGFPGQMRWDADYIYVCTDVNTWKRTPIATW